jgi:hypothetical protein
VGKRWTSGRGETMAAGPAGEQGLDGLTADQLTQLVVAYEPRVGHRHRHCHAGPGPEAHRHIRQRLVQWFGPWRPRRVTIHGGSVKPKTPGI